MRERNFIIAYLVFIVLALLYSDYSENKELNAEIEGGFVYVEGVGLGFEEKALINNKF